MHKNLYKCREDIIKVENNKSLESKLYQLNQLHQEKDNLENETINILVSELVMHGKDENQIRQISQISKILGLSLGLGAEYCNTLEQAAKIYDIGNILICSEVYEKEDKLSFEEFKMVKEHTTFGYDILIHRDFPFTKLGAVISKEHHEWWNGSGYPSQLLNEDINIASRIVAVADTVGALFRKRPGRTVWQYDKILEYLETRSGIQFDPDVVDVFLINQEAIHEILITDLESVPSAWYA